MNARFKLYAELLFVRIRTNFFLVKISAFTVYRKPLVSSLPIEFFV